MLILSVRAATISMFGFFAIISSSNGATDLPKPIAPNQATPSWAGIAGKTIELEMETTGFITNGVQKQVQAGREATKIRISKNGRMYYFANLTAERGIVFELNRTLDVAKNPEYGDPTVFSTTNISVWRNQAAVQGSTLTFSSFWKGTSKREGAEQIDESTQEIAFSADFKSCVISRVRVRSTVPAQNVLLEINLVRSIRCVVLD
jgi:hypothetical protein